MSICIISHKTVYPAMGPRISLHDAAMKWLARNEFLDYFGVSRDAIVFVSTLEDKLKKIAELQCTHFIDDLTEVLNHPDFPGSVEKLHYSLDDDMKPEGELRVFRSWDEIEKYFFCE